MNREAVIRTAIATVALLAGIGSASAQDQLDPLVSDVVSICGQWLAAGENWNPELEAAGWTIGTLPPAPGVQQVRADRSYPKTGNASLLASVETFPTTEIGRCSVTLGGALRTIDIRQVQLILPLTGTATDSSRGTIGAWQDTSDPPVIFIRAAQTKPTHDFIFQMTTIHKVE